MAYNFVKGNPVLYPISVVALFVIYISVFYLVFYLLQRKKEKTASEETV